MSIAVTATESDKYRRQCTSGGVWLTGSNTAVLQSSFLTLLVAQLKTRTRPIQWKTTS